MSDRSRKIRTWSTSLAIPLLCALAASFLQAPLGHAADAAGSPARTARASDAKPLLPDLTPLPASDLSIQATSRHGRDRKVRFDARLANIGRGPMEVRPNNLRHCPRGDRHASQVIYHDVDGNHFFNRKVDDEVNLRSAGCMVFHPAHNHWHFEAAARYTLSRPDSRQDIMVRARKMSFCLRDSERVPASYGEFFQPVFYGECGRNTPQGISRGWLDLYSSFLVGQALQLPPRVRHGVLCLGIRVDPRGELRESNEDNQTSVTAFKLRGNTISPVAGHPCSP
jgi:hypothetical protein